MVICSCVYLILRGIIKCKYIRQGKLAEGDYEQFLINLWQGRQVYAEAPGNMHARSFDFSCQSGRVSARWRAFCWVFRGFYLLLESNQPDEQCQF